MTPLQSKFTTYGVLNLTPNSFSDGGRYWEVETLKKTIEDWKAWGVHIFDLGAESTAPSNEPISAEIEWERIETLGLSLIPYFPAESVISLDTYRPQTFKRFYREVLLRRDDLTLVFNDVSGVLDEELFAVLAECPKAHYVYSHTHVPERSQTSFHMDFVQSYSSMDKFFDDFFSHMLKASEEFGRKGLSERIILDPCFGFSKDQEQNLALLHEMPRLWQKLRGRGVTHDWLIGISKKSFLQRPQPQGLEASSKMLSAEYLHLLHLWRLLKGWVKNSQESQQLYFRVHNPALVYNMKTFLEFEGHETNS